MKMIMLTYNEAIDDEIMETLSSLAIKSYTKMVKAYGSGLASGTHLGNDIWPGINNILYVACNDDEAARLIGRIRELRETLGKEGVKAFMLPVEEVA